MDLRNCAHRRPWVPWGPLLPDGHGRRKSLQAIYIRLLHEIEKLPGVGGKGLYVPSLTFCVDRVKREGGFAGAGRSRQYDESVSWDVKIDTPQVVLSSSANNEAI